MGQIKQELLTPQIYQNKDRGIHHQVGRFIISSVHYPNFIFKYHTFVCDSEKTGGIYEIASKVANTPTEAFCQFVGFIDDICNNPNEWTKYLSE